MTVAGFCGAAAVIVARFAQRAFLAGFYALGAGFALAVLRLLWAVLS